ncbi:MAG: hypothetical protein ILM98_16030 [Kiritimatiellae bacterium]|nr:hypothetical protein [Kiritimatiellia bacterium]
MKNKTNGKVLFNFSTSQLFNLSTLLAAVLCAATSSADVPQVLTYRGVLQRTGGYERTMSLEMTFRLYDSTAPDTALWARTMRVPVDTNGVFYAELCDANGNDPDGIGYTLADAMGAIKGTPEIGLTPPNAPELKPRQTLPTSVRAARAVRAKAADVVYAPTGAYVQGVDIGAAAVGGVTVQEGASLAAFPPSCTLTQVKDWTRDLGGGTTKITVRDVTAARPNWPVSFVERSFKYTTGTATTPCDMILTYEGEDGAFNVIVPAGGKIAGDDGAVQTIYGTAFGTP